MNCELCRLAIKDNNYVVNQLGWTFHVSCADRLNKTFERAKRYAENIRNPQYKELRRLRKEASKEKWKGYIITPKSV